MKAAPALTPGLALLAVTTVSALWAAEPAPAPKTAAPAVARLVWQAPQRVAWQLAQTPLWFSLGHTNRVLCFLPKGATLNAGKPVTVRDGSGSVYAIDVEIHEVAEFAADGVPRVTRCVARETVAADDPAALKRQRWPFPTEQKCDWELSLLPVKAHQKLFRLYVHEKASAFWYTLMVHTEADLEPLPPALAEVAGAKSTFRSFLTHVIVCELLNDPALKLTSTYIEPDDPPSTTWINAEKVKAPWALGKERLEPMSGSVTCREDGTVVFSALTAPARAALARAAELDKQARINYPTAPGGEGARGGGAEADLGGGGDDKPTDSSP